MKKKMGFFLAVLMAASLFSGCKSSGNQSVPASSQVLEKQSVEISVVTSYGGDDGNRQNYERAYKAYEAASGNTVSDYSAVSNEEWKAGVMAAFESGEEPDVLFYFAGVDANRFVADGKVVPIDEIRSVYPDYASNMKDDMLPVSPADGKTYAVPVNGYWEGLFANKKVLADCGVDVPGPNTTWDDFIKDCEKILAKGYVPIALSLKEGPHYWFEFCVLNNGDIQTHTTLPQSASDAAGEVWAAGLEDIKDLYTRGFFPQDTLTASSAETDSLMVADKAAFMIEGSWKLGWFAENAADVNDFTVTYVPGKGERPSTDIIGGLSMGYFITRRAWDTPEKQAACVEFIKFMTADDVVATFGATSVTALKNGIAPPSDANSLVKDALAMTNNVTGIAAATQDGLLTEARGDLFANISNVVTGQMTAAEAIDHCLTLTQ